MTPILELANVRAGYGESVVLQDLSLSVGEGEIVCLLGANGAGKTTTTRVVSGLMDAWAGDVRYAGKSLLAVPAHKRVEAGICLSPEGAQVFANFTVRENLLMGSYTPKAQKQREQSMRDVFGLFPRLEERREQKAGLMSGGEQQMLAIGRALMGCPRLLMLDEPSLGLAPKIVLDVYAAVAKIAERGLSILFVEQNVRAALLVAHRGYVLANGRIVAAGTSAELERDLHVREAFLGRATPSPATTIARGS
jgi:branched-chain amino acid transport system ATP-binding protein